MLTLEQVRAVNDGFHDSDLSAALAPLEETIDLRANELPRLDKKAVAALKDGLKNGDDAATWAQAVFHPNVSVRRFARKVLLPLGDEAAPLFVPLRARLERFWGEEEPLPETFKPREAALRREQNEQVSNALELLLRCNPEAFLEFYAQLADNAPAQSDYSSEMQAWAERNRVAWDATQKETSRLLEVEWGTEWIDPQKRYRLPSRVLRELDERARQKPEIAAMWKELEENPWESIAPEWDAVGLLLGTWNAYLNAEKPSGPIESVNARLRPVLWGWLRAAFDFERPSQEREKMARRLLSGGSYFQFTGWFGRDELIERAPALLLASKPTLFKSLKPIAQNAGYYGNGKRKGKHLTAGLWVQVAIALGQTFRKPYNVKPKDWQLPAIEPEDLRALTADLEIKKTDHHPLLPLVEGIEAMEKERVARPEPPKPAAPAMVAPAQQHKYDEIGRGETFGLFRAVVPHGLAQIDARAKFDEFERETLALGDEERVARLVEPPSYPGHERRVFGRLLFWKVWARELGDGGAEALRTALWPRAEPLLWARYEAQLEAHRRLETEPIEPDVEQKLTEREAKEWRARVRREKRHALAADILDIADLLIHVDGLGAHLRAIELADRPGCREIRDQLERKLFYQLEEFPGGSAHLPPTRETWEKWKLDESWDAILERAQARLSEAKDEWTRNVLERELASGYYRRGDFARFEAHLSRPEAFPYGVAKAAVFFDDFEAWRALVTRFRADYGNLEEGWQAQQSDPQRRARALEIVAQTLALTNAEENAKPLLKWFAPLDAAEFEPLVSTVENALESALPNVKKWAMSVLSGLPKADFDRELAAQTASEALWSENVGLAKDAAKFLAILALADENLAELAWSGLEDATALENVGVCEAVFRALVKVKSKNKHLGLGEAAHDKLALLAEAQSERFGKFEAKLVI